MAHLRIGGSGIRLGVSGKSSYKTVNKSVKVTSTQRTSIATPERATSIVIGSRSPSYKGTVDRIDYREHFNIPADKVAGVGPYLAAPAATPPGPSSCQCGTPFSYFGRVDLVPVSVPDQGTPIVTYLGEINQVVYLQGFQACGDADATYFLEMSSFATPSIYLPPIAVYRTTTANLNAYVNLLDGVKIICPGVGVRLRVVCTVGGGSFYGTLLGYSLPYTI